MTQGLVILTCVLVGISQSDASIQQFRGSHKKDFSKLGGAMQPTVAARTLSKIESEWRSQALLFAECQADGHNDCGRVQSSFQKSCGTVVTAVVAASSGDRDTVHEYMDVVCNEPELKDWKHERCQNFAKAISNSMTADNYENREHLNMQDLCLGFWARMSSEEGARAAQERALQAKRMEAEHALVVKEAKEAAEALAAATAAKKAKTASEAKHRMIDEKRHAIEEQHKRQVAERAAHEAKIAAERAERAAAAKALAEKRAAQKADVQAKIRQRQEAARKSAEAQAAQADAKLAQSEREEQETKRKIAAVEAAKQKQQISKSLAKVEAAPHEHEAAKAANVVHTAQAVVVAPHQAKTQQVSQPHAAVTGKQATKNKK